MSHINFRGVEVQTQIVRSKFDQALFGPNPCAASLGGCTSTEMFEQLHRKADVLFASKTHWHSQFGHLVTYGVGLRILVPSDICRRYMDKCPGLVVDVVVGCGPTRGGYDDMEGDVDSWRSKGSEGDDTCLFLEFFKGMS
jgi:hypothetical protein